MSVEVNGLRVSYEDIANPAEVDRGELPRWRDFGPGVAEGVARLVQAECEAAGVPLPQLVSLTGPWWAEPWDAVSAREGFMGEPDPVPTLSPEWSLTLPSHADPDAAWIFAELSSDAPSGMTVEAAVAWAVRAVREAREQQEAALRRLHRLQPQHDAAVEALGSLASESPEAAQRAYAEATAEAWGRNFVTAWRARRRDGRPCVRQLLPDHYCADDADPPCETPPGLEHLSVWDVEHPGGYQGPVYIAQPYALPWADLQALSDFAHARGLTVEIRGSSWHRPGGAFTVLLRPTGLPHANDSLLWG